MKKLLLVVMLGVSALSLSAQKNLAASKTLSLVMRYTWTMDAKTYKVLSETKCSDGIEFDFTTMKAMYYTPDADIAQTRCNIIKVTDPVSNSDGSTTYEYKIYKIGLDQEVDCILNVSKDLKEIKFTMLSNGRARVYRVSNMITDDQDN